MTDVPLNVLNASSPATTAGRAAVEFSHVGFTYEGAEAPALVDVSLVVQPGERLGILGPNGGGKSTLLKLALGLLRPSTGHIQVMGVEPARARRDGLIGYVPQKAEIEAGFPLSVRQVVTLAGSWRLSPWRAVPGALVRRVQEALELVGVADLAARPIGRLSGGQLQRVMIARALMAGPPEGPGPRLLVLDEPLVGIDAAGQAHFAELLERVHAAARVTLLVVSHDLRAIAASSDQVACLSQRLHYHASPKGLTPQVLADVFSHDVAGIADLGGALAGMHVHAHGPGEPCPSH